MTDSVRDLFAAQVRRTPDAVAVVADGQALRYHALDTQAEQLAARLTASGIQAGSLVGVRLERSPARIISLLAVLKAGEAYLPLDPAYPAERSVHLGGCRCVDPADSGECGFSLWCHFSRDMYL